MRLLSRVVPANTFRTVAALALVLCVQLAVAAEVKSIRLKNATLSTSDTRLAPQAVEPAASGLFLVQFDRLPTSELREALGFLGVQLLRYIPDDAFIARFDQASPSAVRGLDGVHWVGPYRPDYKVAARLRELAAMGGPLDVAIAMAPGVSPVEALAVRRALLRLERESKSRFGSILHGRVAVSQLAVLARSPAVLWLEPAPRIRMFDEISAKIVAGGDYETGEAGEGLPDFGGGDDDEEEFAVASVRRRALKPNDAPANDHRTTMTQLGFDGRGVVVSVADSGLHNGDAESMHPDLAGRVDAFFFYGSLTDAADEHSHGTHVAGIVAGNGAIGETDEFNNLYGLGVAPGAHIVAQRIFDGVGNYEAPPTYETLTRDAVRAGAVIGSNSWGDDTQGGYDLSAAAFDALVRDADELTPGDQPYILEFSAGNAGPGPQTVGSPAVGKNVIATGASQNDRYGYFLFEDGTEAMADFSSRGPCADGRIKPDIVAPGTWIASLQSESATDENAWSPISANYQFQGGTSQSGPHASGAAAIFVQYWRETHAGATPSPALVKAALVNSAVDLDDELGGTEPIPNHDEGWGRIDLTNLIGAERGYDFIDQSVTLTNLQVHEHRVLVGNPRLPLKVTLTYTDVPGLPAAVIALVNDLDLEVLAPDGTLYRGNAFDAGDSIPNALAADPINNVEGVHLTNPQPGEYLVRVRASRVAEDAFRRPAAAPAQDFALAVSGDLPLPGQGIVALNRVAYTAPSNVEVKVIDFDLRGQASITVTARSDSELPGESIQLNAQGTTGVFTGLVALATGPAIADGRLQVAHGDVLEMVYADASPANERVAAADVDLLPPVLSAVSAGTRFGRLQITWASDEPADSIVEFGSTPALGQFATNRTLVEAHRINLDGLQIQQTVYYRVRSRDAAGNERLLDNAGVPFQAQPSPAATVLLVDQFDDLILNDYVTASAYTDALDTVGVSYELWDSAQEGRSPVFEELRNYRVVIWRNGEFVSSLTPANIKALRDYVDAGGSLFMASMELLSRLDEGGFDNFRRNVLHVEDYDIDPGIPGVYGRDNLSMTSGVDVVLDFSEYPDFFGLIPQDVSDTFRVTTNAVPILLDSATGKAAGVRYPRTGEDGVGRVVFFAFPLDAIPVDGDTPNRRADILQRVLSFLAPGVIDRATVELDREEYALPAVVTVELTDREPTTLTSRQVLVRTGIEPNGQQVELLATGKPGIFRGSILLVPQTNAPTAGQLRTKDGDLVEVLYTDTSPAEVVTVAAVVDTQEPAIDGVTIDPDYNGATVSWTTSEPTDALVQYFDVGFPSNFTTYRADFTDLHELELLGLEPDREYAFRIVCRDPAGNTLTDDNQGNMHRFRTLKPLSPPFADNLESGATNWTVGNSSVDEETLSLLVSSTWELGSPNNELADAAHSPSLCWGTNLRGEANDFSDSSLISPAILLTGGNRATLRFWHNYDFFPRSEDLDIVEVGGVYVTTNNGAAWTPLREFGEASAGWEEEEIDLSPYLGKVIRLGWAYGLLSLDSVAHPGWLVDDVDLTVTRYVPGTLILSNNLHQAVVTLRGPLNRTERGAYTSISRGGAAR
jgi:hypothetical protein